VRLQTVWGKQASLSAEMAIRLHNERHNVTADVQLLARLAPILA